MNIDPEILGKIVSAALFYNNSIYYCKKGHHAIFTMEDKGVLRCATQGFVTENGFFVDRVLGLYIAEYYNQIDNKHNPTDQLLSEDLLKEDLKVLKYIKDYNYKEKK